MQKNIYLKSVTWISALSQKKQIIDSLNNLATRYTATYSDMPKSPNLGNSRLEECVMKIINLED